MDGKEVREKGWKEAKERERQRKGEKGQVMKIRKKPFTVEFQRAFFTCPTCLRVAKSSNIKLLSLFNFYSCVAPLYGYTMIMYITQTYMSLLLLMRPDYFC